MKNTIAAGIAATKSFRIVNARTGVDLGSYCGRSEAAALAGYYASASEAGLGRLAATEEDSYIARLALAEDLAEDLEQKWDEESTIFTFRDGSKLRFNGPEISVA